MPAEENMQGKLHDDNEPKRTSPLGTKDDGPIFHYHYHKWEGKEEEERKEEEEEKEDPPPPSSPSPSA